MTWGAFLSTLSLRRATISDAPSSAPYAISIHALLAESDVSFMLYDTSGLIFLSTLSLRRATGGFGVGSWRLAIFLSTLSLRRATPRYRNRDRAQSISIHALLAESDCRNLPLLTSLLNFYPRSPCGERRINRVKRLLPSWISIHALLAESDTMPDLCQRYVGISIHALLAESDRIF